MMSSGRKSESDPPSDPSIDEAPIKLIGWPPLDASSFPVHLVNLPALERVQQLFAQHCLYALPKKLWTGIVEAIGARFFDAHRVKAENVLCDFWTRNPYHPGLWKGQPIFYGLLSRPDHLLATDTRNAWAKKHGGLSSQAARFVVYIVRASRAYAGWLLTNRQFVDEHDALLRQWGPEFSAHGFADLDIFAGTVAGMPPINSAKSSWLSCLQVCRRFLARWRLRGLAAPGLPIPIEPLASGELSCAALAKLQDACGAFILPDTMPIPSRDQLRAVLDHELHALPSSNHLAEWHSIIRTSNSARNLLARYGRLFELQHHYRVLHERHDGDLYRRTTLVKRALGTFFGTNVRTIHSDLAFIAEHLGEDWIKRARPQLG